MKHFKRFILLWLIVANLVAWVCYIPQHDLGLVVGIIIVLVIAIGLIGVTWGLTRGNED